MSIKIVNVSDKPYDFTYDGKVQATMLPNESYEFEDYLALHAIKKSEIMDDEGQVVGFRVKKLSEIEPKSVRLHCPLVEIGECKSPTFANLKELSEHMAAHGKPQTGALKRVDDMRL